MEVQGKYNKAKIFTDNVDSITIGQIINLCNQKEFKEASIRIMPDCHAGKGCTIGTTMTISDKIVPNLVGVDIGCGMATIPLEKYISDINYIKLDKIIRDYVPHGFKVHNKSREKLLKNLFNIDINNLRCEVNKNRACLSLGTLGGGNHFIEVDKSEKGQMYLTVHTGSRNLGKQIADYYQDKAIKYCVEKYKKSYDDAKEFLISTLKKDNKEHLINKYLKDLSDRKLNKPHDDLCYLENDLMEDYLHDMSIAQKYAAVNRMVIIADILFKYNSLDVNYDHFIRDIKCDVIECIHNYIDMDSKILRKGAISANKDETVIIPINMRDGIILGKGKGNSEWNYSAPHGAGRILSRGKAKEKISLDEFEESMKEIFTTCVGQSTLDEAPQAYKPIEDILNNIGDTIEIMEVLKPVYNFKSN
ncbi:TPA: RtcB family protein [Clostridioides difficile]|nr:RtcB family protein [Clostridioides difficile]OFU06800.1 RNA-splicing ligase RtcB [Clostridium sp. HMSC19D07]MBZ0554067.1 RtcB family protein [Clostridioides difficile]MCE4722498.1 RtcB family protein [Clostridioides difficile]MCG3580371.1 RtcB family protein [Clostridioides difficile]